MASNFHFFEDTLRNVDNALSTYVSDVSSNVIGSIAPTAYTLMIISLALLALGMFMGKSSEPIMDVAFRIIKISVITYIAIKNGTYSEYVADKLYQTPDAMAAVIASGGTGTNNIQYLDALFSKIYDMGKTYSQQASAGANSFGIPNINLKIIAYFVWGLGTVATGYAAFLLILSKIALSILLGLGPIFILLLIFDSTKKFFDSWIGQALNYVFLPILTASSIKLMLSIVDKYLTNSGAGGFESVGQAMPVIVICLISALVLMQLTSIASALGGGVAISTLCAASWAADKVKGGLSLARPTNARRAMNKVRSDARIAKEAASTVGRAPGALYRKITGGNRNRVSRG